MPTVLTDTDQPVIVGDYGVAVSTTTRRSLTLPRGYAESGNRGTSVAGHFGIAIAGDDGIAVAGDEGVASAGVRGTAIVGEWGAATVLSWGSAVGGFSSRVTAGSDGRAVTGVAGVAEAGVGGTVKGGGLASLTLWTRDGRKVTDVVEEGGLLPDTFYRLVDGLAGTRFVPVPE